MPSHQKAIFRAATRVETLLLSSLSSFASYTYKAAQRRPNGLEWGTKKRQGREREVDRGEEGRLKNEQQHQLRGFFTDLHRY